MPQSLNNAVKMVLLLVIKAPVKYNAICLDFLPMREISMGIMPTKLL